MSWGMGAVLVVVVCFALPTLWVYCSHYFTLKARFNNEGKGVFLIPVAVGVFGFAGVALIHGIGGIVKFFSEGRNGWGMPGFIYWLPIIAGFVVYMVKNISVGKLAKEARKEEGLKPVGLLVALALTCVFPIILGMGDAKTEAAKERASDSAMIFYASQGADNYFNMYAEPNENSNVVGKLKDGDRLTATGNVVRASKETGGFPFVEANLNGTTGWVYTYSTHTILGTATVIADNATWEHYEEVRRGMRKTSPIPNGATVAIVGYDKKTKKNTVMYQNLFGWIDSNLIKE
jgi:hypothetical protein